MEKIRLGVNIDHVATIRNARGGNHPDPVKAAILAQDIGMIAHQLGLFANLTVSENLNLMAELQASSVSIPAVLQQHNLARYQNKLVSQLSEGLKKRVALCKLSLLDKKLWLLDEPFAAIDKKSQVFLNTLIEGLREKGCAIILSSHQDLEIKANLQVCLS